MYVYVFVFVFVFVFVCMSVCVCVCECVCGCVAAYVLVVCVCVVGYMTLFFFLGVGHCRRFLCKSVKTGICTLRKYVREATILSNVAAIVNMVHCSRISEA